MFALEPVRPVCALDDEELRAVCVRAAVRHGDRAAFHREGVEIIIERVPRQFEVFLHRCVLELRRELLVSREFTDLLLVQSIALRVDLVLEGAAEDALAARSVPVRVAPLDHEIRNDTVERQPVVEARLREEDEIRHGARRAVRIERKADVSFRCMEDHPVLIFEQFAAEADRFVRFVLISLFLFRDIRGAADEQRERKERKEEQVELLHTKKERKA